MPETTREELCAALALEYHKAEDGSGEGEYGCPGLGCPGVKRLAAFADRVISAFLRSSVERQPQVARLVPQWSLQAASARQRGNKIEAVTLDFCCDDLEKALAPVSVAHQPEEPVTSRAMKDAQR